MAAFDPSVYLGQESNEIAGQFLTLKKDDLKALGKHLNLDVKAAMKKAVIQKIIADHLMSENIVEKGSIEIPVVVSHVDAELRKLELQLELKRIADNEKARKDREELRKLELAAEDRARQEKIAAEDRARQEKIAAEDRARQEKIAAEDKARQERLMQLDLEQKRLDAEERARKEKLDAEERARREKLVQEKEIELARLAHSRDIAAMQSDAGQAISSMSPLGQAQSHAHFNIAQWFQTVPKFRENAVEDFFVSFEKMADRLKWPTEYWTALLQHVLVGKGLEVFNQLGIAESANFEYVKEAILKAYQKVPEAYRQKFRNYTKASSQTYTEFAHAKQRYFDQWCHAMKVQQDFERLRQIILIEEFKESVNFNLRVYIDERAPTNLNEAAHLADEYALIHQSQFHSKSHSNSSKSSDKSSSKHESSDEKQTSMSPSVDSRQNSTSKSSSSTPQSFVSSSVTCNYCKGQGHVVSECLKLQRKHGQQSYESQPKGIVGHVVSVVQSAPIRVPTVSDDTVSAVEVEKRFSGDGVVKGNFEPFIHDGFVSLSSDFDNATPIKILRDTGASHSLLLVDTLPFSDLSYSGANVLLKGIDSDFVQVPRHNIHLKSRLVSGPVTVGVRSSLPTEGIHLLLGNDLAGDKVVVDALLTPKPCVDLPVDPIEKEIPGLYPVCAVTRSMSKKAPDMLKGTHVTSKKTDDVSNDDIDLGETFVGQALSDSVLPSNSQDTSQDTSSVELNDIGLRSDLINKQRAANSDTALLFQKAVTPEEAILEPVCFYLKDGVLMRKWRPPQVPANEDWAVQHQIVVPTSYRPEILSIAHETPLSGHLGVNKTFLKILKHFYWPNLKKDVAQFCRSCHTCQMVGKPNQTIPKAHLQPIPAFEEPFSRVLIDCVGPLPKTRSGNEYMLTVMCTSTRFPEAIPLRNIKAKTVVNALVNFFTKFGLPKSVQSDQGSNFMSGLFQQVMHELGIKQYKSSAYHPESQGALERFHQTLKNMIRSYCFDTERNWDEGVHLLLFAVRESVQESLGFSPFELVFGHTVRGPLRLLKEKLLEPDAPSLNLLQYVTDMKTRLQKVRDLAKDNLKDTQNSMAARYNQKAVDRSFIPGDQVLVLLPVTGKPLEAQFHGPYTIAKKESDLNYIIRTPDRRKKTQLCHINMLKPYHDRGNPNDSVHPICTVQVDVRSDGDIQDIGTPVKLNNSEILQNVDSVLLHLDTSAQEDMKQLLTEFNHLFPDVPTRTDQEYHDVDVGNVQPSKQHPYRLSPEKQEYLHKEVQYLLDHDFIEPSKSNWSSPCILVPKPDGSYRLCTDYRKVNSVTKTDTFPIPRIDDCIDKVGNAKIISKYDLLKGFWQVPLTERAKQISAFVTPDGLFQYKVMPFGMKNSPATFQRLINQVTSGLSGCDAYIDDVVIYSDTWEEHLDVTRKFFERLSAAKLTVNLSKCEFGKATVTFLGHVVGHGTVKPIDAKVRAICELPAPVGKKQLMRFLGMAGYYRKFCPNFSTIAEPLTRLLGKKVKFVWSPDCETAFQTLKAILRNSPVLAAPDFTLPFNLAVDASDVAAGAVLLQEEKDGEDHPVCYYSKKFNKSQEHYSTIEKECLALVLALQYFEVYLSSSSLPIKVFSDHNPLVFIDRVKNKNHRLLRWSLMLQQYNLDIKHIRGKDNLIADCLSRI